VRDGVLRSIFLLVLAITALWASACGGEDDPGPKLDAPGFQQGYDQFSAMIDRAASGDIDGAEEAFGQVLPLARRASDALADRPAEVISRAELVDAVVSIEQELHGERRADVLAQQADAARSALADAAEALGVERPHEPQGRIGHASLRSH
jgi:hypothetical protein